MAPTNLDRRIDGTPPIHAIYKWYQQIVLHTVENRVVGTPNPFPCSPRLSVFSSPNEFQIRR